MDRTPSLPGIAVDILSRIDAFDFRDALAALDDPERGGALAPPRAGLLRARAHSGLERWQASYDALSEVRKAKDLTVDERIEAQVRSAAVLRFASNAVDFALDLALAAARAATHATTGDLAADARIEAALLYGKKRCRRLAEAELDAALATGRRSALVWSARADLALTFDDRVKAKECFERAATTAEETADRRGALVAAWGTARLHTVLGEFDHAAVTLGKLGARPAGDVTTRRARWRLLASQGKWAEVADVLGEILLAVPDGDASRHLMLERASALYRAGAVDSARAEWTKIAASAGDGAARASARMLERLGGEGKRKARLLAFPSVTQLRNHCGPASVELCLRFFGTAADQIGVAREIKHPDGGTPVHRMRSYMDAAGFLTRRVEASLDTLRAILDAGVPVIIEEDYSTTRHVAVAIGYDDRREILEIQDPMTHEIRETAYEDLPKLREFSNHGALVAVPKDRADLLAKLDAAGAIECAYMTLTDRAWAAHDREEWTECDRLATEAIALHEAYELAWVLRFVRARGEHQRTPSEGTKKNVLAVLDRILQLWPDDEWPQQFLGRVHDMEGRAGDALAAFERARDRDPADANNWCSIGDQHVALGDRPAARTAFEGALARDAGHVRANENLAWLAVEGGDVSLAALLNACARELAPDNPFNHHVHGQVLARTGALDEACTAYARAVELAPSSVGFVLERAKILARAEKIDDALASLETVLEKTPKDIGILVQVADLAYVHDRLEACHDACRRILEIDAKLPTPRAIAGAATCKQGKLDEGLAELRAAIAIRPTYTWARREIGRALMRAGRPKEAIEAFASAAGMTADLEMVFRLGDALAASGFANEALPSVRRAASGGSLTEDQLVRCAAIVRQAEGVGSAHGFLTQIGENHPRETAVARAHVRFLLEDLWYPGAAAKIISRLSEIAPDDAFVLANEADDLMDKSMEDEARGEALFQRAIASAGKITAPRRMFAKQLVQRGRYAEALSVLSSLAADVSVVLDRVDALLGLWRDAEAHAAIDAFAAALPEDVRAARRRPLDYEVAKVEQRWADALELAKAIAADEGELEDDGELGRWEKERFACLAELGRADEAYTFGVAQCANAKDKARLAYAALTIDKALAKRLGDEAFAVDPNEAYALTVAARVADCAGDVARAKALWKRMKEVSPWHIHDENLARLALAEGDLPAAEKSLGSIDGGHCCPVALELQASLRVLSGDRDGAKRFAERARACLPVARRDIPDSIDALVATLDGKRDETAKIWDSVIAKSDAASDAALYRRVRTKLEV